MSETHYWPCDPPDDAVILVRVTGTVTISQVRSALNEAEIPHTMGGTRRDDVTFYVPKDRLAEARRLFRAQKPRG